MQRDRRRRDGVLKDFPLRVWVRSRQHSDEVVREVTLLLEGERSGQSSLDAPRDLVAPADLCTWGGDAVARSVLRRQGAVLAAALLLLPLAATPAQAATCADVFPASFAEALGRDFPAQRVTAAVTDTRTGCSYDLHPGLRITTASVIKAGVLGAVLLKAQDGRRGLTAWERARIRPMIEYSHNNPYVSDLYGHVGGVSGMDRADRRWGATGTSNSASYGATWTTARDRTRISLHMLHGGGALAAGGRSEAWQYMRSVHPTQRWGISAGVPSGWGVALKNGFYPMRGYGWRVGSTGFVRQGTSGGYAFTVLTDGGSSQVQGMRLVEAVSRRVAARLAGGPPAPRSVDRAVCTSTRSGESWSTVAARVGASPAAVRTVSGGNPSPLQGQRACSPTLRP
ncbi:MAG: secreted protein [Frankiales bacterium]|nr:secreted protein [Frankiales bacterium]